MSRLFISPFRSLSTTSSILSPLQEAVSAVTVAGSTVELLAPLHSPSGMVATIVLLLEAIAARLIAPEAVAMPTSKLSCRSALIILVWFMVPPSDQGSVFRC
uniref:(northern house mosquito) hypothetical protein n=1 Tax=Culex pipiens TaxID=7175 RepID=A0A8D8JT85_CULPI